MSVKARWYYVGDPEHLTHEDRDECIGYLDARTRSRSRRWSRTGA